MNKPFYASSTREIAYSPTNEVASFIDKEGVTRVAFRGTIDSLAVLETLNDAAYSPTYKCLTFPMSRSTVTALETLVKLDTANDNYKEARHKLLSFGHFEKFYPKTPINPKTGKLNPPPFEHQIDTLGYFAEVHAKSRKTEHVVRGFANFAEQGTGKSRSGVDFIRFFQFRHVLIVCKKIAMNQWKESFEEMGFPSSQIIVLNGTIQQRATKLRDKSLPKTAYSGQTPNPRVIYIMNWEAVARLEPDLNLHFFDCAVLDESNAMKSRAAQVTKALLRLRRIFAYRLILSGTPMDGDPSDLFTQYKFIDESVFGGSFHRFAARYCKLGGFTGRNFMGLIPEYTAELIEKMYSRAYRVTKATAFDMPPKLYRRVVLEPSEQQARIYRQLSDELFASERINHNTMGRVDITNSLSKVLRLQQVTAGILTLSQLTRDIEEVEARENEIGRDNGLCVSDNTVDSCDGSTSLRINSNGDVSDRDDKESEVIGDGTIRETSNGNGESARDIGDNSHTDSAAVSVNVVGNEPVEDPIAKLEAAFLATQTEPPTRIAPAASANPVTISLGGSKTAWVVDFVRDAIEEDSSVKIIVWERFTPALQHLVLKLSQALPEGCVDYIDGSVSMKRRDEIRHKLNDRSSELKVCCMQLQAGAYSMNLPCIDYLIYHSNSFSYTLRSQSEDRGHRAGRTRPYEIIDLVLRGTVDSHILRALSAKKDLSDLLLTSSFTRNIELDDEVYQKLEDPSQELEGLQMQLF